MNNKIKRLLSCFSVLTVCLLANMGIEVKAVTKLPIATILQNKEATKQMKQTQQFTLHNGTSQIEANQKIADHYSHRSHFSHSSHFSSSF